MELGNIHKSYRRRVILIVLIILLIGCQSVSKEERMYESALELIDTKKYPQAIGVLSDLGNYKKSKQLLSEIRYIINGSYIGVGNDLFAAIQSDRKIIHRGGYENSLSTQDWNHIKALSTKGEYIEGLDEEGKIVTTYPYSVRDLEALTTASAWAQMPIIENLPKLKGVSSFQTNYPRDMLALLENGTVHVMNPNLSGEDIATIQTWEDIVEVATNGVLVVGLKADGSVAVIVKQVVANL
jgi:hypothetical protein